MHPALKEYVAKNRPDTLEFLSEERSGQPVGNLFWTKVYTRNGRRQAVLRGHGLPARPAPPVRGIPKSALLSGRFGVDLRILERGSSEAGAKD